MHQTFSTAQVTTAQVGSIPSGPTATGTTGQWYYDATNKFMYRCVATNTWVRHSVGAAFGTFPLTWVSNGDTNGIFYSIATQYNTTTWSNPHTAGLVTITRSSDTVGTAADIVDRVGQYSTTSNGANEYIKMDLGATRTALVTNYSLRNGSQTSGQEIRNWKFQGSTDGTTWVDIETRTGDTTMASTNQSWAHYTIATPGTTSYRFFRVYNTGVGAGGLLYLQVCEVELYGTLSI